MVIRRIGDDEWEAWRALRLAALADAPWAFSSTVAGESALTDEEWRERTRLLAGGDARAMFVADEAGALVACGGAFPDGAGSVAVTSMWTAPSHRGRGLARRLLTAIEEWARARGARRLVLDGNAAESVYARAGFGRTGNAEPMRRDAGLLMVEMERLLEG
jgi:GNAT superfamily N-acetyltransferase